MSGALRAVAVLGRRQGSGVVLDRRHVLTSAHVVGNGTITVAHPEAGSFVCTVAWSDPGTDVAMLESEDDLPFGSQIQLGRLATEHPVTGCQVVGFPAVQREGPAGTLRSDQFPCQVLPAAGRPGKGLTVVFEQQAAAEPGMLAGLSGAPVLAGDVLLGVVTRIPFDRGQYRAEGTPLTAQLPKWPQPLPVTGHTPVDSLFEADYAVSVEAAYRRTKIFGLDDLSHRESQWDLDIAYLSLEAEERRRDPAGPAGALLPVTPDVRQVPQGPQRIDDLLAYRRLVLLRGEAGAGKTTLMWWLAAHCAQRTLGGQLSHLNNLVPFVVPLRTVHARIGGFPTPGELPTAARLPVDPPPDGWATRVLSAGRGLLLIDGLDEIPAEDREAAHDWLSILLRRFPGTRCVVTARPQAVGQEWLTAESFDELRLLPMRDDDIQTFVTSWHRAARLECDDPAAATELDELERDLTRRLQQNTALRDLARTPLLCAVICALHRKRQGFLPSTRFQLYRSALDMLLGHRDERRRVRNPEGIHLTVEENYQILQRFAVWLVRCGQLQFTREQITKPLEQALSGMPRVRDQGTPDTVFAHLLNRSGLLQELTGTAYEFIHRTFRDFLAAKELVEGGYVGEVVNNASDEFWRDVVLLAAGHCGRQQVHELLEGLLLQAEQSRTSDDVRADLFVLAAECAQHVAWVGEDVAGRIRDGVAGLVPPVNEVSVERLARLGAYVLPLLPGPEEVTGERADRTVELICRIGGSEAVPLARRFAQAATAGSGAQFHLGASWKNFPTSEYAREVLSVLDAPGVPLQISSAQEFAQVHLAKSRDNLQVTGDFSAQQLAALLPAETRTLGIGVNSALTDLSFVRAHPSWQELQFFSCPHLRDLSALRSVAVSMIRMNAPHLSPDDLAPLGTVHGLKELSLFGLTAPRLADLPAHPDVSALRLEAEHPFDLQGLDAWTSLTSFGVTGPGHSIKEILHHVLTMPKIVHVVADVEVLSDLAEAPAVPHVAGLVLSNVEEWGATSEIPRVFPSLRQLVLSLHRPLNRPEQLDLRPLHALRYLSLVVLPRGANALDWSHLEILGGARYNLPTRPAQVPRT